MKKLLCAFLALALVLSLAGCASYEDTNGADDFTLQTLTEADILNGANTTKVMASTVTVNSKTTCKAKTFSGVEALYEAELAGEPLDLLVSSEVTKGNARLVLVVNDEIVHDFALNEENQHFTLENVTGEVALKIAGEDAGYVISFTVN